MLAFIPVYLDPGVQPKQPFCPTPSGGKIRCPTLVSTIPCFHLVQHLKCLPEKMVVGTTTLVTHVRTQVQLKKIPCPCMKGASSSGNSHRFDWVAMLGSSRGGRSSAQHSGVPETAERNTAEFCSTQMDQRKPNFRPPNHYEEQRSTGTDGTNDALRLKTNKTLNKRRR